jgi:hypothetical protein
MTNGGNIDQMFTLIRWLLGDKIEQQYVKYCCSCFIDEYRLFSTNPNGSFHLNWDAFSSCKKYDYQVFK